jgi:hypothetical protein
VLANSLFSGIEGDTMNRMEIGSRTFQVGDSKVIDREVIDNKVVDSEVVNSEVTNSKVVDSKVDSEVRVSRYGRKYTKHHY